MKRKNLFRIIVLFIFVLPFLAGCGNTEDLTGLYKPTNIKYNGSAISWDKVSLADYYMIEINAGEKTRVNTNMYTYDSENLEFDVSVYAVVGELEMSEDKHFIPLDSISNIYVSNTGLLTWESVLGASSYEVYVNGSSATSSLEVNEYQAVAGRSTIKVKPLVSNDDSYYSYWSEEVVVTVNSAPTSIKYDGELLSWSGSNSSYDVKINGVSQTVNGTSLTYNSQNNDFYVEVVALGDYTTTYDSVVTEDAFFYLDSVVDLVVEDGILSWGSVNNATGYTIRINGVVQSNTLTEELYANLTSGKYLEVEIKAINTTGNYFSNWSELKNIYILESPTITWNSDLELDGQANNNLIWDIVNGANGYAVEVTKDGYTEVYSYSSSQMFFAHDYLETGEYTIRVKALADITNDFYDSQYSTEIVVNRLAAPVANTSSFITSDSSNLSSGFTANYVGVTGASGYQLYKDGVILDAKYTTSLALSDTSIASNSATSEQNYTYVIRSIGNVKTSNGVTTINLSSLSSSSLSFNITVQAMPTNLLMNGYNASWDGVTGNNGYAVKYDSTLLSASSNSIDMSVINTGSYDLSVCTKGNGSSVLASSYTSSLSLVRLSAPTNIEISYGTGEGQLEFTNVAYANSYQIYLDNSNEALPENAFSNMYQYITEQGSVLSMISVANYYNDLGTVYYMSSQNSSTQQFIRLAAPTFSDGAFASSTEIVWNSSSNINTSEYTPTYELYESNVMVTGGVSNATKFNIEYLKGGFSYTFRVKAIGNDSKYLDSELSSSIAIYKLQTPEFIVENGSYVWEGVTNASSYVMEIDGVKVYDVQHVSGSSYSYTPSYTEIGSHTVVLYAVGDGYNNIDSDELEYIQEVKKLDTPEIQFSYSNDSYVTGGTIDVVVTKESPYATKYLYEIAGESIVVEGTSASKIMTSTGSFVIRVLALGGVFDKDDTYYIDSAYVGGSTAYTITLLAAPTLSSFSINSDGVIKWSTVTGAYGYEYSISYNNGTFSDISSTSSAAINPISDYINYSSITIKVRAKGDSLNTITSDWVTYTWTRP